MGLGYRLTVIFCIAAGISACASKPLVAQCEQRDWFELGRNDGAQGSGDGQLKKHARDCRKEFRSDWETMYTNGRNAGLVEYCTADNAFQLGKTGQPYFYVCPSTMEQKFLSGYRRGQRARDLELESKKLESKADSVPSKVNTSAVRPEEDADYSKNQ